METPHRAIAALQHELLSKGGTAHHRLMASPQHELQFEETAFEFQQKFVMMEIGLIIRVENLIVLDQLMDGTAPVAVLHLKTLEQSNVMMDTLQFRNNVKMAT